MITKRSAVSLSGSALRRRHGGHQAAMGKRHHRRTGSLVHRGATILAAELWICHGDCCESEASGGDNLVSYVAPRASALRMVDPDGKAKNPVNSPRSNDQT
jgi:hypothetical protein